MVQRRPLFGLWLLVGIVFVAWIVTRFWRGFAVFGLMALIVPLAVLLILLGVTRAMSSRGRSSIADDWPPPRNVTPAEPTNIEAAPSTPHEGTGETLEGKLRALDRLRADGLVSDAEYEAKRAQLISDF